MAVTVVVRSARVEVPELTFDSPRIVIGRSKGCEVRLPDPSVSQRHASIRQRGADYLVQDEGSTNGTFVGPVRLPPGAPRLLKSGDRLRVGRIWLEIRIAPAAVTDSTSLATKELALRLVAAGLADSGEPAAPVVTVTEGSAEGLRLELSDPDRAYVVGRGQRVDLTIDDPDLSRQHVEIRRKGDRLMVRDLGSKNGSTLGDTPLSSERAVPWPATEPLRLGSHALGYDDPVGEALAALEHTADEKLPTDGSFDEPSDPGAASAADDGDDREDGDDMEAAADDEPPPEPSPPKPAPSKPTPRPPATGWTWTDALVALAALVVLTVSIAGIWWLLRTD